MRPAIFSVLCSLTVLVASLGPRALAEEPAPKLDRAAVDRLLSEASIVLRGGDLPGALERLDRAVAGAPEDMRAARARARLRENLGQLVDAVEDYSTVLEKHPDDASVWNQRGGVLFKLARIDASIRDFDEAVRLRPNTEAGNWQRGISYYYAGRYAECRRQFEIHRTVNPHDVENAAWHFLCAVREQGLNWARERLIPIETDRDTRVPMHEIYQLFSGSGSAEQVVAAAGPDEPEDDASRQRHNYAHLYLGLWYEAMGEMELAHHHMGLAARRYRMDNYMGFVSRVHLELMHSP